MSSIQVCGNDRLFVYLRLEGDNNSDTDTAMVRIQESGHPAVRLDLRDRYDLGAEFYRWEYGTAVAGAILGINPFDQPNVQGAKDMTERLLGQYQASGKLPDVGASVPFRKLLSGARTGDYLAIMAYVLQTPETDRAFDSLRRRITERYGIATTLGYGPRFLHSTGQLHKGGPGSGLFLQLTTDNSENVPIPGYPYTFAALADAQALGDLEALQASGRRTARVQLGRDKAATIHELTTEVTSRANV